MDLYILSQDGEIVLHYNMKTAPELFLKAVAAYRAACLLSSTV